MLGFWVRVEDWADSEFDIPAAGKYEVEVQQGCGQGSGGSRREVGGQTLKFTGARDRPLSNSMILRNIGEVELPAGKQTLAIKPQTKPGAAVMDVRRIVLRPRFQALALAFVACDCGAHSGIIRRGSSHTLDHPHNLAAVDKSLPLLPADSLRGFRHAVSLLLPDAGRIAVGDAVARRRRHEASS